MNGTKRTVLSLLIMLALTGFRVDAEQKPGPKRRSPAKISKQDSAVATLRANKPVTVVSAPSVEYLSGEASVTVRGNDNAIIRLGLAQGGVTIVEFPAADRFFALHPGNSEMVTVDDSPTKASDHFFVFRAGTGFLQPPPAAPSLRPAASIIAQMQSGLVVTFLIYPVRELAEMAHRVVVMYNRDEVVAARKLAGLAVDLDAADKTKPPVTSLRIAEAPEPEAPPKQEPQQTALPTSLINYSYKELPPRQVVELENEVHKALKAAMSASSKIKNWSAPVHGLSVATVSVRDLKPDHRLAVIAVRNTLNEPLRIVPGAPEITIETRDAKERTLQVEHLVKLVVESSGSSDPIPPGSTLFYAILFPRPILGSGQSLRVAVAQANAADQPVTADLVRAAR